MSRSSTLHINHASGLNLDTSRWAASSTIFLAQTAFWPCCCIGIWQAPWCKFCGTSNIQENTKALRLRMRMWEWGVAVAYWGMERFSRSSFSHSTSLSRDCKTRLDLLAKASFTRSTGCHRGPSLLICSRFLMQNHIDQLPRIWALYLKRPGPLLLHWPQRQLWEGQAAHFAFWRYYPLLRMNRISETLLWTKS